MCVCVCMDDGGDQFQIIIIILYWDFELDIFPLILRQLLSFFQFRPLSATLPPVVEYSWVDLQVGVFDYE